MSHSSTIRLWIEINGTSYPLSQVTPSWVVFASAPLLGTCSGVVVVEIDGVQTRRNVILPYGTLRTGPRVRALTRNKPEGR